jgi:hypothetical protein
MAKGRRAGAGKARAGRPRAKRQGGGGTGSITNKAELGIQCVDFFDYNYQGVGGGVKHYFWDCDQNLFNNNTSGTSGQQNSFCRIRRVEVFALPRKGLNNTVAGLDSNSAGMFTTNVQCPGLTYSTSTAPTTVALATNTQVTNVLPQVDTVWKKVFTCDMQKTFQSGVVRPYYVKDQQCLFSLRLLDPVTGTDIDGIGSDTVNIKIKVVIHLDQPIMPIQKAQRAIVSNNDVGDPAKDAAGNPPVSGLKYMQMDLKRVLHNFS